jgi:hypothetical protein
MTGLTRFDCGNDIALFAPQDSRVESAQGRTIVTAPGGVWRCVITRHAVKGTPSHAAEAEKVFKTFALRQSAAELQRDTYDLTGRGFSALARDYRIAADMGAGHLATLAVLIEGGAAFSIALTAREVPGDPSPLPVLLAEQLQVGADTAIDLPLDAAGDTGEIKLTLDLPPLPTPEPAAPALELSPAADQPTLEFAPLAFSTAPAAPATAPAPAAPPPATAPTADAAPALDLPGLDFGGALSAPAQAPPPPRPSSSGLSLAPAARDEGGTLDFSPAAPQAVASLPVMSPLTIPAHGVTLMAPAGWAVRDDGNGIENESTGAFFLVIEALVKSALTPESGASDNAATVQARLATLSPIGKPFQVSTANSDVDVHEYDWQDESKPEPLRLFVCSWYSIPTEVPYLNDQGELLHLTTCAWFVIPKAAYERESAVYRKMLATIDTKPEKSLVFSATYAVSRQGNSPPPASAGGFAVAPDVPAPQPRPKLRVFSLDDLGIDIACPALWKQGNKGGSLVTGDKKAGTLLHVEAQVVALNSITVTQWGQSQTKPVAETYNARLARDPQMVRRPAHEAVLHEFNYVDAEVAAPCKRFVYSAINTNAAPTSGEAQQVNLAVHWRIPTAEFEANEGLYRWLVQTQATLRRPGKSTSAAAFDKAEDENGNASSDPVAEIAAPDPFDAVERGVRKARWWILGALLTYVLALIFYAGLGEIIYEAILAVVAIGMGIWGTVLYARAKGWAQWALVLAIIGELIPGVGLILLFVFYDRASKDLAGG